MMSPRGGTVSSQYYISSSGRRVNAGIRRWTSQPSTSTWCQNSMVGIRLTHKFWAASLLPGWGFDNSKRIKLARGIFKCISWTSGPFYLIIYFLWRWTGFLKARCKTYLMAPMSPLSLPTYCFLSARLSLWRTPEWNDIYGGFGVFAVNT
jgi:hypothetical protein